MDHYTVTVHVAAPGTPLKGSSQNSVSGHMYLSLRKNEQETPDSYGFQPTRPGMRDGEKVNAEITSEDYSKYQNPRYSRTLEVTREQYEAIKAFASRPQDHGFNDRNYNMFSNSCIDFVWDALQHAGIRQTIPGTAIKVPTAYDGELKVLDNIPYLRWIEPPVPGSPLNTETIHPLPERNHPLEYLLSHAENGTLTPAVAAQTSPMLGQCLDGVQKLDAAVGRTPDAGSLRMACSLANLAHDNGLQQVDSVYLSRRQSGTEVITGERVFVQQGDPRDPAGLRAGMPTAQAIAAPLESSLARLEGTEQQLAQQRERSAAQTLSDPCVRRGVDGPALG